MLKQIYLDKKTCIASINLVILNKSIYIKYMNKSLQTLIAVFCSILSITSCSKPSICDCANSSDKKMEQECSEAYKKEWQEHMKKAYIGTNTLPQTIDDLKYYRKDYFLKECEKSGGKANWHPYNAMPQ